MAPLSVGVICAKDECVVLLLFALGRARRCNSPAISAPARSLRLLSRDSEVVPPRKRQRHHTCAPLAIASGTRRVRCGRFEVGRLVLSIRRNGIRSWRVRRNVYERQGQRKKDHATHEIQDIHAGRCLLSTERSVESDDTRCWDGVAARSQRAEVRGGTGQWGGANLTDMGTSCSSVPSGVPFIIMRIALLQRQGTFRFRRVGEPQAEDTPQRNGGLGGSCDAMS